MLKLRDTVWFFTRPPEILTSKTVLIDQNAYAELKLPCSFQYVGPVKGAEDIEANLEAKNKLIKFKAKEILAEATQYKATCKNRIFKLNLEQDENTQTLYQALNISDGIAKVRKLTEREKIIQVLEKHMDVKVIR